MSHDETIARAKDMIDQLDRMIAFADDQNDPLLAIRLAEAHHAMSQRYMSRSI